MDQVMDFITIKKFIFLKKNMRNLDSKTKRWIVKRRD